MILLKSLISDGSSYDVFDNDKLIGYIHLKESTLGNRFLAFVHWGGEEKRADEEFVSPQDALQWIEKARMEGSGT